MLQSLIRRMKSHARIVCVSLNRFKHHNHTYVVSLPLIHPPTNTRAVMPVPIPWLRSQLARRLCALLLTTTSPPSRSASAIRTQSNLNALLLKMPRNNKTHIADAQRQRQRIKEKASRYIPGTVNLQILGSGAPGSPASVYLFTDQSRYLFNCGEGTQRLAHEHKTKLSRLEHIFVTRTSWQRIGGLPGLSLTVQDSGVPSLALHGPPGLDELFRAMRRFVILKELSVQAVDCAAAQRYEDSVLSVQYVPLMRSSEKCDSDSTGSRPPTPTTDDTDYFAHESGSTAVVVDHPTSNGGAEAGPTANTSQIATGEETQVMAFVCQLKPRPGALSLEKCVDRGVPPGPLLGQLKNGHDVRLADGTVVLANEVRAPDDPGPAFCVLDIPSVEYLDSLESRAEQFVGAGGDEPALLIHFTPANVIEHPRYQRFMGRFGRATTQLVLNETNRFSGYLAAHRIQCQLNQISEHMFPLLQETPAESEVSDSPPKRIKLDESDDSPSPIPVADCADARIEGAASLTYFHLRPFRGLDRSVEPRLCHDEYRAETKSFEGFSESLAALHDDLQRNFAAEVRQRSDEYPRVVFLGTGSCIPNKTRNVSSILVHTSPDACILLDCGEGTAAQMRRFYGHRRYREVLAKLGAIYVSHLHADHHIGLIGVLQERRQVLGADAAPVLLLAPKQISSWLYFYDRQIESLRHEYELVHNGDLLVTPLDDQRTAAMGISSIRTCLVRHCPHSFGIAIECAATPPATGDRFKLTYSGDTMPCDELVQLGSDSTVLIHEATMEDELAEQARYKMHSTVSQAIEQGRRMRARYTVLTHFSQRYAKLPRIESAASLAGNVFIAFDNMEVTLSDMRYLGRTLPTMQLMFTDHCEEMEQKALKRAFKAERALEATNTATV